MEKKAYKYIVAGGGLSGLSTAYELSKIYPGEVLVLEKDNEIGGLAKTINRNNSYYDLGSHRIHNQISNEILAFLKEIANGSKLLKNIRGGKLRLRDSNILYPIKSLQFFISLGFKESLLCAVSLIKYRILGVFKSYEEKSTDYETYLIYKAGKRAYTIFYEPYARKVWKCDPKTISLTAVKKRMSMVNPIVFVKDIISIYFKKDTISHYYYLSNGIGDIAKGLGKKLYQNNVKILTNVKNFSLNDSDDKKHIEIITNGDVLTFSYDTLISTIPINELVLKLQPDNQTKKVLEKVKWRGLKLIYLHLNEDPMLSGETFYFPEIKYIFGRVSIPKRFSESMQPEPGFTSYVCEVPYTPGDDKTYLSPEEIYLLCYKDLLKAQLIKEGNAMQIEKNFIIDLPIVYPMYTIGWQENIMQLLNYLQSNHKNIFTSGKLGFFMHCNMDHSIDIGRELAQNILENKTPAEWYKNINRFHNYKLRD